MPKTVTRCVAPALALFTLALGACGSDEVDATVAVATTDETCEPADTELSAGNIRFELTNNGKLSTELYVLGKGDRVIGEVENVVPGTTRELDADLKAGDYTLVCKPGQTGEGIRVPIEVTGSGGSVGAESAVADKVIDVDATEYAFAFSEELHITKGQAIEFELANKGAENHEFEMLRPDGDAIGEIPELEPGKTDEATFEFTEAGTYTYQCILETADGTPHSEKGMTGTVEVA